MEDILQAQEDAQPMRTVSDMDALEEMSTVKAPPTTTLAPYSVQPVLEGATDSSAVLQKLMDLETMIQNGFDKISSKLANTMISAAPASSRVSQMGGKRRTKRKTKQRRNTRSK